MSTISVCRPQALSSIGETPPRLEPAPLSTFARPPPDKYATIRTGGKYDKSHKYAQQMEQEESAPVQQQQQQQQHQQHQQHQQQQQQQQHHQPIGGTLDRRSGAGGGRKTANTNQRSVIDKTANGTSIVHQPLPDPPTLAPQPLSAAHFTQYRSPAPPTLPCCTQANQQSQHRSQNRSSRTPEKFFSTSSQSIRPMNDQSRGGSRQSHSHTLDRRHGYQNQANQGGQNMVATRTGSQTLDRRSRQSTNPRSSSLAPIEHQQNDANKDLYAVTEL